MQLNAKVISVSGIESVVKGKQRYKTLTIVYSKDGKEEAKKLVDFNNKEVFETASSLSAGDNINITIEKQGDFWNWTNLTSLEGGGKTYSQVAETRSARPTSTFETSEERAKKQIYIVRQSSLGAAIEYFKLTEAKKVKTEDIMLLAKQFENFVFDNQEDTNSGETN